MLYHCCKYYDRSYLSWYCCPVALFVKDIIRISYPGKKSTRARSIAFSAQNKQQEATLNIYGLAFARSAANYLYIYACAQGVQCETTMNKVDAIEKKRKALPFRSLYLS